jgi:hypothetical protein
MRFWERIEMPLHTILIIAGAWILLLVLTVWKYTTWKKGRDD